MIDLILMLIGIGLGAWVALNWRQGWQWLRTLCDHHHSKES